MDRILKVASTSQSIDIFIRDSSNTALGLAGLVFNTTNLKAYYRNGYNGLATAISLVTLSGPSAAYSSGGFVEIDATNMKGWYRLDLPDAVVATGTCSKLLLFGAANMVATTFEIELVSYDPYAIPPSIVDISAGVLDVAAASHNIAATIGAKINSSGSASDPLQNPVGTYSTAGTVGKLIVDDLNATISSRLPLASYVAPDNTSITAIKAKTDNLPSNPAATGDAMSLTSTAEASAATSVGSILPLKRNTAGQHVYFFMRSTANPFVGLGGTPTVMVSKDGSGYAAAGGAVTDLGNGEVDFSPSSDDVNAVACRFRAVLTNAVTDRVTVYTHV